MIRGFDAAQEQYDRQEAPEAEDACCKHCGEGYGDHEPVRDEDGELHLECHDGRNEFEERDEEEDAREQAAEEKWNENR